MPSDRRPGLSTPTLLVLLFVASIVIVVASVLLTGSVDG